MDMPPWPKGVQNLLVGNTLPLLEAFKRDYDLTRWSRLGIDIQKRSMCGDGEEYLKIKSILINTGLLTK